MKIGKFPLRVVGTVGCALTIGFFMDSMHKAQHGDGRNDNIDATVEQNEDTMELGSAGFLPIADIKLTSANPTLDLNAATSGNEPGLPQLPKDPQVPELGCTSLANAAPSKHGFIDLHVAAPCQQNKVVAIHHAGLVFSDRLGPNGTLDTIVPALSENATIVIEFEDGGGTVATAHVRDVGDIERIALQWEGDPVFSLHAMEGDAEFGDDGHLWAGAEPGQGASRKFMRLGNPDVPDPRMVEVYTYPAGSRDTRDNVSISVEAEVTAFNCARNIDVQAIEMRWDSQIRTHGMSLKMPDCGAVGDFLVLNNLMEDLKIAAN